MGMRTSSENGRQILRGWNWAHISKSCIDHLHRAPHTCNSSKSGDPCKPQRCLDCDQDPNCTTTSICPSKLCHTFSGVHLRRNLEHRLDTLCIVEARVAIPDYYTNAKSRETVCAFKFKNFMDTVVAVLGGKAKKAPSSSSSDSSSSCGLTCLPS